MLDQPNPKIVSLDMASYGGDTPPLDQESQQRRLQLEASFDKMASVLEQVDWKEADIKEVARAAYEGMSAEAYGALTKLSNNLALVDLKPSQIILWKQWISGMSLEDMVGAYNDPERHSIDKLRMQVANLVAKLGAQTY